MRTYLRFIPLAAVYLLTAFGANAAGNRIEGVVLGPDQKPVPDAQVQIRGFKSFLCELPDGTPMTAQTDSNGCFSVVVEQFPFTVVIAKKQGLAYGWKGLSRDQHRAEVLLGEPKPFGGQVVDEAGKAVPDALVQIMVISTSLKRDGQGFTLRKDGGFDMLSTRTDAQGQFAFAEFGPDAGLELRISKEGYAVYFSFSGSRDSDTYNYQTGTEGHLFALEPEAVLEGTVVNAQTKQPIADIPLSINGWHHNSSSVSDLPHKLKIRTDEKGRFSYRGLWADTYFLRNDDPGKSYLEARQEIELKKGQVWTDYVLELSSGGILEVTVKDAKTQRPIEAAKVNISYGPHATLQTLQTDADGRLNWHFSPGACRLNEVFAQGYRTDDTVRPFTIEDGKTVSFDIVLKEYPRLEGTLIRPDGRGAEDIEVQVFYHKMHTTTSDFFRNRSGLASKTQTDPHGHFFLWFDATDNEVQEGPGAYLIYAYDSDQNLYFADAIPFGQPNTGLRLKPGMKVVGSLVDQKGVVVGGQSVSILIGFKTGPESYSSTNFIVKTDADGRFEFGGVPTHPETLGVSFGGQGFKQFSGKVDPDQARDGVIQLQPITVHKADVVVRGKVVFADGSPAAGAAIEALKFMPGYVTAKTDEQGMFELTVLELPVEITANKTGERFISYSGKASATQPDQDVTITLRSIRKQEKEKEAFLPVVDPNER